MKCLSVRAPWPFAIFQFHKDVENRDRSDGKLPDVCRHRGPLLIHVSASCTSVEYGAAVRWMKQRLLIPALAVIPPLSEMRLGHIIGVVDAYAHCDRLGQVWAFPDRLGTGRVTSRWHIPLSYGLLLREQRLLATPVPFKGQLGIYDVPDDLVRL